MDHFDFSMIYAVCKYTNLRKSSRVKMLFFKTLKNPNFGLFLWIPFDTYLSISMFLATFGAGFSQRKVLQKIIYLRRLIAYCVLT